MKLLFCVAAISISLIGSVYYYDGLQSALNLTHTDRLAPWDLNRVTSRPMGIVCLGDSHTEGPGVSAKETYPSRLESALNARAGGQRVEVVNAGLGGACIIEKHDIYKRLQTRHGSVVLQLGIDLERVAMHVLEIQGGMSPRWKIAKALRHAYPESPWAVALWALALRAEAGRTQRLLSSPQGEMLLRRAQHVAIGHINGICALARERQVKVLLLQYGADYTEGPVRWVIEHSEAARYPRINMDEVITKKKSPSILLPDGHLNSEGYALFVRYMLDLLPSPMLRAWAGAIKVQGSTGSAVDGPS